MTVRLITREDRAVSEALTWTVLVKAYRIMTRSTCTYSKHNSLSINCPLLPCPFPEPNAEQDSGDNSTNGSYHPHAAGQLFGSRLEALSYTRLHMRWKIPLVSTSLECGQVCCLLWAAIIMVYCICALWLKINRLLRRTTQAYHFTILLVLILQQPILLNFQLT